MIRCGWMGVWLLLGLSLGVPQVLAQVLPGVTVEERAINGAKEYIKKNNLKHPSLTMLMMSLFKNAMPTFAKQWEDLTGVKMTFAAHSYSDIPAKIMAEAVAKTGEYDIFNQFPYVLPDAVSAEVIMPMDEYAARGQPDFSGLAGPLRAQQSYNGKLYFFLLDGAHLMLVLRQDLLELPEVKEAFQAQYGREPGCPVQQAP